MATISISDAELLNFITGGLLGLNVKLSVADTEYSSLLSAGIDLESYLDTLVVDLSVANKSDAVAANITLTQAIDAAITVLQSQGGNTVAIATLEDIKLVVPANTFSLLDVINLNVEDSAVLSTTVNVLDFHMLILQAFNHQNAISAEDISLNLSALGLDGTFGGLSVSLSDISAAIIAVEGPKLVSGSVGTAFTTSSIRLKIFADLVDVAAAPLSLGLANVAVNLTDFELYADVSRANGTVEQLSYLTQTLRLNVTPGVASLYLGQISAVDFNDRSLTSDIDYATEVAPVVIGSINIHLGLANETIALEARANANVNGALESLDFIAPFPESKTTTAGVGVINSLLSSLLSNTVLSTTPDPTLVDTTLLLALIRSLVVDDILSPVISDIVTNFADPTAEGLGISIGNATQKVFALNGDSCIPTVNSANTSDTTPLLSGLAYRSTVDSEQLNIVLNNITYQEGIDFVVTENQWSLTVPPEDSMPEGVYNVDATVTNGVDSVSDQSTFELTIDLSQPTVQIQNVPTNSNSPFTVTFAYSEPVTDFILADISVGNGTASNFTTVDSSNYTALITPAADGAVTLDVNANVAQDTAGNLNTAATQVSSTFTAGRPSVQIQNVPANSKIVFTATFAFSKPVTGFILTDILVGNGIASNFSDVDGSNYTALITPTVDGAVTLDVNANVAQDSGGNLNTAAVQVSSQYDATRPSVAIQNVPANSSGAFTATIAFSEPVSDFIITDILVGNGIASNFIDVDSSNYTALITPTADGAVTVDVSANVAQDTAGNFNTVATQVSSTFNSTRPSVQIQNVPANSNSAFTATFAFSKPVINFIPTDITLSNATVSTFIIVSTSSYTALITPTTNGAVTIDINENVAQDLFGNLNTAATQVTSQYDASRPSVAIQNVPENTKAAFIATFAFDKIVTGFIIGDISVSNGTASNFISLGGSLYTALITPTANGVVTLNVNENVAQDLSGNLNTAAAQVSSNYDTLRPSVAIQNVPENTNGAFTATIVFSEPVSNFILNDISVSNATVSDFIPVSGSNYTALITPIAEGVVTLNINENVAEDLSINLNTAATQVSSTFNGTRPSVQIQNVPANSSAPFTATFAFSEPVIDFIPTDITVTNATVSTFIIVSTSSYSALITPTANGAVTLDVNANVAQDIAGNLNTAATRVTSQYDATRPSVAIQNVPENTKAAFIATFAFDKIVTGFIGSDISISNGRASDFLSLGGSLYTALITPTANGVVTLNVNENVAQDLSGNLNTAAAQVSTNYDTLRPSVAIQNVPENTNGAFTATIVFSEPVSNFILNDISVSNATVSDFIPVSGSNYTALITPIAEGVVTLNINENVAEDLSINLNTAATQVSSTFNGTRPSVQIQNVPANSSAPFTATFAFSEPVIDFIPTDITVTNATVSTFIIVSTSSYTALITPTANGAVTLDVNANVAQDIAGNLNTAATQVTSQYDASRPSVAIQNVPENTKAAFIATFAFDKIVTDFIIGDISVSNGTASNFISLGGSLYTALITPTANGVVTIDVNANVAQDISGNLNTAATQVSSNYDTLRPSVAIQNVPENTNGAFTATIVFSEPVSNFILNDISVSNATVSDFIPVSGSNYTALITPIVDGVVTLNINENVAEDLSINLNTAATQVSSTFNGKRPSVQIQNVPANSSAPFTATFTFSEPVIDFIPTDITVTNATVSTFIIVSTSSYTALITPTANGAVTLGVNANVAQDIAGNLNTAATQVTSQYDASRPSVQIQNVPANTNIEFIAIFTFSESVIDFTMSDISVTNAIISTFIDINGSSYTALISPIADGEITLNVNANVAQNNNGNLNTMAAQVTSLYDTEPPELTIFKTVTVNIVNQSNYKFEGTCSDDGNSVVVKINNLNSNSVNCDAGQWALNKNMRAVTDGLSVVTINANQTDNAGNIGSASPVAIDKDTEKPIFTIDRVIYSQENALIFSGTSDTEDGTEVTIIESTDNTLCVAPVNENSWVCESSVILPEGTYDLRAEAEDKAENLSIIYFSKTVSLDEDNDGISNLDEGYGDTDNDGIPDAQDTDSDSDGVLDSVEGIGDDDGDNIPNFQDSSSDEDMDGIPDVIEGNTDVDNDGIINALDPDSDNDGIVDGFEARLSGNDSDQDGIDDIFDADIGGDDPDGDGITYQAIDTDNDGIADYLDKDSDGDGIPDAIEAFIGFTDIDNDGIWDRYDQSVTGDADSDNDGIIDSYDADQTNGLDADNDGINDLLILLNDHNQNFIPDHLDIDSDSDGIRDGIEAQVSGFDHDNDGIDDTFDADLSNAIDANSDGIIDNFTFIDTDADGVIDMNDLDSDNDGDTDTLEANVQDDNRDGIIDVGAPLITQVVDTDEDNIPDHLDSDKNNDGTYDIQDNAHGAFDNNNDGQVDITADIDGDGIDDSVDGDTQVLGHGSNADSDNDSVLDVIDKDDDNDGIADITERSFVDDGNETAGINKVLSTNTASVQTTKVLRALDTDNDGIIDEKDRDSDNDGISDLIENGRPNLSGFDHDMDGIDDMFDADFTGGEDNDLDGVDDIYNVKDTDGDSVPDYLDLDSDNDKISDNVEQLTVAPSGIDANRNGIDDAFDPAFNSNQDDNLDGIDDTLVILTNPDGDDILNFQDVDSDGDSIRDIDEQAVDFDGDGTPNYLDLDSDNDAISDAIEGLNDFDTDGASNFLDLDSDNDGISDATEGVNDFDSDGASNFLDLDSDNDGISDAREGENDFDSDGASNYLDLDSDNDGISDAIEGETDFDGDGASNFLDLDSDGDGISDAIEGQNDADGDGSSNYLDLDSDGDGVSDIDENGDFDGDGVSDAIQDKRHVQSSLKGSGNVGTILIFMLILFNLMRYRASNNT
ncbi:Ig-like domain-containing protein [Cognaticolwellia beringensis]|uniref:Ig-like domain-containing protein n=1 Tax=Cognaticolwellia beringensis TaxID=1967665 RepID=UPI0012F96F60|nr:Ig-like domain-containing protein [Cognaticolwellia beringensis]